MKIKKLLLKSACLLALIGMVGCGETPEPTPVEPDPTPVTPDPTPVTPDPEPEKPDPEPTCNHDYIYVSDGEDTHHQECSLCKEKLASEAHQWDEGVKGKGIILYTCTLCGQTKSVETKVYAENGFYNFSSLEIGDITEKTKFADGIYLNASSKYKFTVDANSKTYTDSKGNEISSDKRLKFNGATQAEAARTIQIDMETAGIITVYSITSSSSDLARQIAVWDNTEETENKGDALIVSADYEQGKTVEAKSLHVAKEGTYYVGATSNASNFYAIEISYDTCNHEFTTEVVKEAACNQKGSTQYTCKHCQEKIVLNDIARSEHKWSETLAHANGYHWVECEVCHEEKPDTKEACTADPARHEEADTPTKDNPETYSYDYCSVCGGKWKSDTKQWVDTGATEVTIADASAYQTTSEQGTDFKISDNCHYIFNPANTFKVENDKAGIPAFKMDKGDDFNFTAEGVGFVNKYFVLSGLSAGDEVAITVNSGGSSRGIRFGADESLKVTVAKNTDAANMQVIKHTVTTEEATDGVKFSAWGGTIHVSKIVWNKQ